MKKQRKKVVWIILLYVTAIIVCIFLIFFIIKSNSNNFNKFSCNTASDCVSQCSRGCVNYDWAALNPDTTECFRAWDCSCVSNECYTDGNPPKS